MCVCVCCVVLRGVVSCCVVLCGVVWHCVALCTTSSIIRHGNGMASHPVAGDGGQAMAGGRWGACDGGQGKGGRDSSQP